MAFEKFGALERTDLEAMPLEELYKLVSNRFKTVLGAQATPEEMETTAEKTADVLPETTGNVPAQGDVETVGEQGLEASGLAAGTEETLESEYTNLPSPDAEKHLRIRKDYWPKEKTSLKQLDKDLQCLEPQKNTQPAVITLAPQIYLQKPLPQERLMASRS